MNKNIKNGVIFGLTTFLTLIICGLTYAAVSNTVSNTDTLTATMWNEMANNYQYSTSEINTGKKWIDGKDIYRKVFSIGAAPVTTDIDVSAENINYVIELRMINRSNNGSVELIGTTEGFTSGYYGADTGSNSKVHYVYYDVTNKVVRYVDGGAPTSIDGYIVMEYTKN